MAASPPTAPVTPAGLYHRLSSYSPDRPWSDPHEDPRVRADFIPMRPGRLPAAFKEYPAHLPVVPLPRDPAPAARSLAESLAGPGAAAAGALDLGALSAVLFQAAGVLRVQESAAGRPVHYRAAASAGNRHPVEVYLAARDVAGLPDGVWHYDPRRHALVLIGPAPLGRAAALVLTGVPWRSCWKYAERGWRHLGWDGGTVAAQALAAAHARGLPARVVTAFPDDRLAVLTGADRAVEHPIAVLPLLPGEPAVRPSGPAHPGDLGPGFEAFGLVDSVHRAGDLAGDDEVAAWLAAHPAPAGPAVPVPPPGASTLPPDELVRRRGSARRFDPDATLPRAALDWLAGLAAAAPPWDGGTPPQVRLLVHGVDGMPAGAYAWEPGAPRLLGGTTRERGRAVCLDQALGGDASFVVFLTAGPGTLSDARGYRTALFGAGLALGRLGLGSAVLGTGCSGLTFTDEVLADALGGEPVTGLAVAVMGRTAYRRREGGTPGAPAPVRRVEPRP